jgi:signal transduction histidine kinase
MRIRLKTLIALLSTTIILFLIIHQVSASVIKDNFSEIEEDEMTQIVVRMHLEATNRYTELDNKLVSYSQKNNTYEFIKSSNINNPETYISPTLMQKLSINYVIFLDENGIYVTGLGLNLTTMQQIPVPQALLSKVTSDAQIWNLEMLESYTNGFVLAGDQPMILASRPILSTEGAGPARGVIIFARNVDKEEITKLSYIIRLPLTVQSIDEWRKAGFTQDENLAASYIEPLNQQSIAGYDVIKDINGQPIFVLGAVSQRNIYSQGVKAVDFIDQTLILSGIIFTITIILVLEFSVLNRLGKLTRGVKKLGAADKQSKLLKVSGNDEITLLTGSINSLLKEIQNQSLKLQKTERFSAIGELARQVGHDLRNPLTSINNAVYYLKRKGNTCTEKDRQTMLKIIETDIKRADKTISSLVDYSSEVFVDPQKCTTKELLSCAMAKVSVPSCIKVVDKVSDEHVLNVDKEKIEKVFTAVISNAVEAMSKEGTLQVESKQVDSNISISFTDTGAGIPEQLVPKVFSPLMTTKAQGIGFGLAISKRVVEAHGGTITFESQVGKGTTFTVTLPVDYKVNAESQNAVLPTQDPLLHYEVIASQNTKNGQTKDY